MLHRLAMRQASLSIPNPRSLITASAENPVSVLTKSYRSDNPSVPNAFELAFRSRHPKDAIVDPDLQ